MQDWITIGFGTANVFLIGYSSWLLYSFRHKEYEISLYSKQIENAEKLINCCADYLNEYVSQVNKTYGSKEWGEKMMSGKFNDDDLFLLNAGIPLALNKTYQNSLNNSLKFLALMPETITNEVLFFYDDSIEIFTEEHSATAIDFTNAIYDHYSELVDVIRDELHIKKLSEETKNKFSQAGNKTGNKK